MIYLNQETKKDIVIPVHEGNDLEFYKLQLENTTTHKFTEIDNVQNSSTNKLLYKFNLEGHIDSLTTGEYVYKLYGGTKLLEEGLMQVGDYVNTNLEYTKTNNTYIEYDGK